MSFDTFTFSYARPCPVCSGQPQARASLAFTQSSAEGSEPKRKSYIALFVVKNEMVCEPDSQNKTPGRLYTKS